MLDIDEVMEAVELGELVGFCEKCGAPYDGLEPDAGPVACTECGEKAVYGAETILLRYV